jgi:hypothetical protein
MNAAPATAAAQPGAAAQRWKWWLALPPVVCIATYWLGLNTGFLMDDFAWLGLRLDVHKAADLLDVLFGPRAQGTVRVLSERVFFLVFTTIFGLDPLPFKIWIFLTQCASLVLLGLVTFRITGMRLASVAAPLVWNFHASLAVPLAWVSGYNDVLWAFCLLAAFYSLLRYLDTGSGTWWYAQWLAYLAGFGALESNVVYPAIAALYCLCCARRQWRKTLPLFVPAAAYAALHLTLIPKTSDPLYALHFDSSLFATFGSYAAKAFGPVELGRMVDQRAAFAGYAITTAAALTLALFAVRRLLERDLRPVFFFGWFALALAPVLPLKDHQTGYYLMAPVIGLAMLAGWGVARAWHGHKAAGAGASLLLLAYATGMNIEIRKVLAWRYEHSARLETVLDRVARIFRRHPAPAVLLAGVDEDLYASGFSDRPFRLYGISRVFLVPGDEQALGARSPGLRGLDSYTISAADAAAALDRARALVLWISGDTVQNITEAYRLRLRAEAPSGEQRRIDAGVPGSGDKLGPEWYPVENGFRWMPHQASVRLAGPDKAGEVLHLEGFAPAAVIQPGPLTLTVKALGVTLGAVRLSKPNDRFSFDFPLPDSLVGKPRIDVVLALDRTFASPDGRTLGLIFGVFEIRQPLTR